MENFQDNSDIIIVGAGPAGCACALVLAKYNLTVTLIEKQEFPRDKICGDAIGGRVKRVLQLIDPKLLDELESFPGKNVTNGWKLFSPSGKSIELKFVNPGYVSRRIDFDNFLFQKVRESGKIRIKTNTEIRKFENYGQHAEVVDQHGTVFKAKLVIGCDGAHSALLRSKRMYKQNSRHYSGAVRAYYENVNGLSKDTIEILLPKQFLPGYFWIFPLDESTANVGFGMLSSSISKRKIDLRKSMLSIIDSTPELAMRFRNASLAGKIEGFGLPLGGKKRRISSARLMLCGDAASFIDPLNGEGIGNAMWSAYLAANHAIACFEADNFTEKFMSGYETATNKWLVPELKKKLLYQRLFNRPWLINAFVELGRRNATFRDWVGKKL